MANDFGTAFLRDDASVDVGVSEDGTRYTITVTAPGYRTWATGDRAVASRLSRELNTLLISGADPQGQEIQDRLKAIAEVQQRIRAQRKAARARAVAGSQDPHA
jgi:hypothetical protein